MFDFNLVFIFFIISCVALSRGDDGRDSDLQHPTFRNQKVKLSSRVSQLELDNDFWMEGAQSTLREKIQAKYNTNKAKNIIMFLGDGMSIPTLAATRMYLGGEELKLSFEKFPHIGLSKTYCIDSQVADSACTATAYLSGVKNNIGTIGVTGHVKNSNCETGIDEANHVHSIARWAQDAGKGTGIVTTTRITHASPAGTFANIASRNWENDANIRSSGCDPTKIPDIAKQLIHGDTGSKFKVILGGGRYEFRDSSDTDEEGKRGRRTDGRNLINEWREERGKLGRAEYIYNNVGLKNIRPNETDYLLGLFDTDHCPYNLDIKNRNLHQEKPTLTEMTEMAIKMMEKEDKGYFLFIEGGRIDMAHHDNLIRKSLDETQEFARAIELAREITNEEDTLIVVTSDHSHTLSYNGYADRGSDILGTDHLGDDKKPFFTMSYANGMGYYNTFEGNTGERQDVSAYKTVDSELKYAATVPLSSETHGGDDVGVFASGPMSHLFIGNYEQNVIPILMSYAAKIGDYYEDSGDGDGEGDGDGDGDGEGDNDDGAGAIVTASSYLMILTIMMSIFYSR